MIQREPFELLEEKRQKGEKKPWATTTMEKIPILYTKTEKERAFSMFVSKYNFNDGLE